MTPEAFDLGKIRERLSARRTALLARYLDAGERAEEELATPASELVEAASEQWDARVLSEMTDTDAHALEGVIAALRRIDAGGYGACAVCGAPIEPPRLAALPEAAECAECARFAEEAPPRSSFSSGSSGEAW